MTARASRRPILRHVLNAGVCAALLVAAGLVTHTIPFTEDWSHPLEVRGKVGDMLVGRNLQVTIENPRLTDRLESSSWVGETDGVWVVMDVTAQQVVADVGLLEARLDIDGTSYAASTRPDADVISDHSLLTGIPTRGEVAFEIPADALTRAARVEFALNDDTRGDSVIVVPLELSALDRSDSVELVDPEVGS